MAAVALDGAKAPMIVEGATDTEVLETYVEKVLAPELSPGAIVVMDNLAPHKAARVAELIRAVGAAVWYLPPYSPDLNPIELMFSKVKEWLRAAKTRTKEALWDGIGVALSRVSACDARNWFKHCGVPMPT